MVIDVHSILTTVGSVIALAVIVGILVVGFKNTSGKKGGGSGNSGNSGNSSSSQ